MKTKAEQLKEATIIEDWKKAFLIASKFTRDFTKDEQRCFSISYESMTGKREFYKSLGIDTDIETSKAKQILTDKFKK